MENTVIIGQSEQHQLTDAARDLGIFVSRANDAYVNTSYKLGLTSQNGSSYNAYLRTRYSQNEQLCRNDYNASWLARRCVNIVAEDMLRGGIEIKGIDVGEAEELQAMWLEYNMEQRLEELVINGRLFGGAVAVIVVDGLQWGMNLNVDRVSKDSFGGLIVFNRWRVSTLPTYNPLTNLPTSYQLQLLTGDADPTLEATKQIVKSENGGLMWVDSSWVLRYDGDYLPYLDFVNNLHWHASILDRMMETINNYMTSAASLSSMTRNATQRVIKIANLSQKLAQSATVGARGNLETLLDKMTVSAGVEGATVLDSESDISLLSPEFQGAVEANENLRLDLCANLGGAPYTKVFGNSASGMNATGEGDARNWYDSIETKRRALYSGVMKLLRVMYRSKFGKSPPPTFRFEFGALWQISDTEKADILQKKTQSVVSAYQAGIITDKIALEELRKFDETLGVFGSVTDEDIELASNQEPPEPMLPEETTAPSKAAGNVDEAKLGEDDGKEK